jgi:hypothetical protein
MVHQLLCHVLRSHQLCQAHPTSSALLQVADIALVRTLIAKSRTLEITQKTAEGHTFLECLLMQVQKVCFLPYAACMDELLSCRVPVTLPALATLWEHIAAECAALRWTIDEEVESLLPLGEGMKAAASPRERRSDEKRPAADFEALNSSHAPRALAAQSALKRVAAGASMVGSGGGSKPSLAPVTEDDGEEEESDAEDEDRAGDEGEKGVADQAQVDAAAAGVGAVPVRAPGRSPLSSGAHGAATGDAAGATTAEAAAEEAGAARVPLPPREVQAAVAADSAPEAGHAARVAAGVDTAVPSPGADSPASQAADRPATSDPDAPSPLNPSGRAFHSGLSYQGLDALDGLMPVHKAGEPVQASYTDDGTPIGQAALAQRPPGLSRSTGAAAVGSTLSKASGADRLALGRHSVGGQPFAWQPLRGWRDGAQGLPEALWSLRTDTLSWLCAIATLAWFKHKWFEQRITLNTCGMSPIQ